MGKQKRPPAKNKASLTDQKKMALILGWGKCPSEKGGGTRTENGGARRASLQPPSQLKKQLRRDERWGSNHIRLP